jgi:peptide/nickel transport system permease protein
LLRFLGRRVLYMVPTLFLISVVSFVIIQLPPGDFLTSYVAGLQAQGETVDRAHLAALEARYGLNDPIYVQYWNWISGIVFRLDFGQSFQWNLPVSRLLGQTLPFTIILSVVTVAFIWVVSIPIGVYSAVRQYSIGDYTATTVGFLGLATPNFLLALLLMWILFSVFGQSVGGLFSPEFENAPWSLARVWDLAKHLWTPVVVVGTAGTASMIRILRANLLDELRKPYVVAARARGVPERRLLVKYPLRVAMNPMFSTIGWILPSLISADVIVSTVLSLQTTGPLLLRALMSQDMFLAGSIIMLGAVLTVIGTLISDLALAWLDPRVRLAQGQ